MTVTSPTLGFVKLVTHDIEGLLPFYTEVFDLEVHHRMRLDAEQLGTDWAMQEIILKASDGAMGLVLFEFQHREVVAPGGTILAFHVPDLAATIDKAVAAGGAVARPLQEMPEHGVKIAFLTDPRGTLLEVLEVAPR